MWTSRRTYLAVPGIRLVPEVSLAVQCWGGVESFSVGDMLPSKCPSGDSQPGVQTPQASWKTVTGYFSPWKCSTNFFCTFLLNKPTKRWIKYIYFPLESFINSFRAAMRSGWKLFLSCSWCSEEISGAPEVTPLCSCYLNIRAFSCACQRHLLDDLSARLWGHYLNPALPLASYWLWTSILTLPSLTLLMCHMAVITLYLTDVRIQGSALTLGLRMVIYRWSLQLWLMFTSRRFVVQKWLKTHILMFKLSSQKSYTGKVQELLLVAYLLELPVP